MGDLSLNEISDRIIEAVLAETYIEKKSLKKIIRPILNIWIKNANGFRTQKASKPKLQKTIEQKDIELKYWLKKLRDVKGIENMQSYYEELDSILVKEGYKKPR